MHPEFGWTKSKGNEIQKHFNWCQRAIFFQIMLRNLISSRKEHRHLLRAIDKEMRCLCDHCFITEFGFTGASLYSIKTEWERTENFFALLTNHLEKQTVQSGY